MSSDENTTVLRCPDCGFRHAAGLCPSRGTERPRPLPAVLDWDNAIARQHVHDPLEDGLQSPLVQQSQELPAAVAAEAQAPLASSSIGTEFRTEPEEGLPDTQSNATRQGAQVAGRVIAIDNSQREPPEFDICRALTKSLWVMLLLVSPVAAFGNTLVALGPVLTVAGVAGVVCLLRFLPLNNILWLAYLTHTNRRPDEQVPVWYARVRDTDNESEIMVRLKGLFSRGNVAPDDLVSFWGPWRDGVLMAQHGFNHRTRTVIQFRQSNWWIWLLLTLVLAACMAYHLHGTWVALNNIVNQ